MSAVTTIRTDNKPAAVMHAYNHEERIIIWAGTDDAEGYTVSHDEWHMTIDQAEQLAANLTFALASAKMRAARPATS